MLKKQLIKDWCAQSWNMEVLFGILILKASRLSGPGMTSLTLLFSSAEVSDDCVSKKVQVGKDQEKAQSEKDSHSKNQGGKKPN